MLFVISLARYNEKPDGSTWVRNPNTRAWSIAKQIILADAKDGKTSANRVAISFDFTWFDNKVTRVLSQSLNMVKENLQKREFCLKFKWLPVALL